MGAARSGQPDASRDAGALIAQCDVPGGSFVCILMEATVDTGSVARSALGEATDAEVVGRVRRGDRDAYRLLVARYQDLLYRYALSMLGEPDGAADVVQATLVNGYIKLSKLRDAGNFGGWIYRMCGNLCRDQLRSARRRDVPLESAPEAVLGAVDRADGPLDQDELRRALDEALGALSAEHRTAFLLKHVEGLSYDDMSALVGASVPALKMRVHRARDLLRSALEEVL
jgi:RNA polymerase sigma-70 factor, ECF subfamily